MRSDLVVPAVIGLSISLLSVSLADDLPGFRRGLLLPTEDSEAWFRENCKSIKAVRLNEIGVQRRARQGGGGLHDEQVEAVPFGEEFVTVIAPPPPGGNATQEDPPPPPGASSADNSALNAFPPIRSQGSLGSCSAFSTTYYQMTHNLALVRGWDAKNGGDDFRFSPKWSYNMINWGNDGGSYIHDALAVMRDHGSATWNEFPYDSNYRAWCLVGDTWRNAVDRRMNNYYTVDALYTEAGLQLLKDTLDNGYVVGFDSYSPWGYQGWVAASVQNDPATTEDDAFVGNSICRYVRGLDWGHAMTVVGYNDHIWCDVNENGSVDTGEKGALKIANSWGTGWSQGGFAWFAYDALKNVSGVSGGPTADRVYGFGYGNFAGNCRGWVMTGQASYTPQYLARFTIRHGKRSQLRMRVGKGDPPATVPSETWTGAGLSDDGGEYAFDGSTTPVSATFYLDATDLVTDPSADPRCFVSMADTSADGSQGELLSFTWIDEAAGTEDTFTPGANPEVFNPATGIGDGATAHAWFDYLTLEVVSETGTPTPAVGIHGYGSGETIDASVAPPAPVTGTQAVCTGWSLTGNEDTLGRTAGTETNLTIVLTNSAVLTWNWDVQYWLDVETSGSGAIDAVDGWQNAGSTVTINATPGTPNGFVLWTGSGVPVDHEFDNPLVVTMDVPRVVHAEFREHVPNPAPYEESFEAYSPGFRLAGTNGWRATRLGAATVSTNPAAIAALNAYSKDCGYPLTADHDKLLEISSVASNSFTTTTRKAVWTDVMFEALRSPRGTVPSVDSDFHGGCSFNADGHPMIWHRDLAAGTNRWTEIPDKTFAAGEWVRMTLHSDYETIDAANNACYYRVFLDGDVITNALAYTANDGSGAPGGSWFAMAMTTAPEKLTEIVAWDNVVMDDVVVRYTDPFAEPPPAGTVFKFR